MPAAPSPWTEGSPCWIDAQVRDVPAAVEFYRDLFGWDVEVGGPETGGYAMCTVGGQPVAGIGPQPEGAVMPDGSPMPAVWTSYLAADDADAVCERIKAAGGQALMEPFDVMDLGRMFVAMDSVGAPFGVWQALRHHGSGLVGEPGAMCWFETHTHDYEATKKFYGDVFGYTYTEIGDGENFVYSQFAVKGAGEGEIAGGVMDLSKMPASPNYWLPWIAVAGTDTVCEKGTARGATIMMGPEDSPFGRMAIMQAPQGEIFGVIDPSSATEVPAV